MSKKKGMCTNEECELCDQIQEVDDTNFVCEKCEHKLMDVGGSKPSGGQKNNVTKIILIVVAVAVLGVGGYFGYPLLEGKKHYPDDTSVERDSNDEDEETVASADTTDFADNTPEPTEETRKGEIPLKLDKKELSLTVGASEKITAEGGDSLEKAGTVSWAVVEGNAVSVTSAGHGAGTVKALKIGEAKVIVKVTPKDTNLVFLPDTCLVKVSKGTGSSGSTVFGGRATYNAGMQTIYIKKTMTLDLHKANGETLTLNPGDKITNAKVQNGYLIQGTVVRNGEERLVTGLRNKL